MSTPSSNGHGPSSFPLPGLRDLAFERRWTELAAESAHVDAEHLTSFAEQRAGTSPVRDQATRNFGREVLEELADARNYLCWFAEQVLVADDHGDLAGEINQAIGQALAATAVAFEHAARARALSIEWRAAR